MLISSAHTAATTTKTMLSSSLSAYAGKATRITAPAPSDHLARVAREPTSPSQSGTSSSAASRLSTSSEGGPLRVDAGAQASNITDRTSSASSTTRTTTRKVMFPSDILERAEALRVQHQQKESLLSKDQTRSVAVTKSLSSSTRTSGITQMYKGPMAEWAKLFDADDDDDDHSIDSDTLSETETICTDEEEEDVSGSEKEEETAIVQALVRAAFEASAASAAAERCTSLLAVAEGDRDSSSSTSSFISRLIGTSKSGDTVSAARRGLSSSSSDRAAPVHKKQRLMSLAHSAAAEHQDMSSQEPQQVVTMRLTASAPSLFRAINNMSPTNESKDDPLAQIKPDDYLQELLLPQYREHQDPEASNSSSVKKQQHSRLKYYKASELSDFFVPLTPQAIASYDTALVQAVRRQDVELLRSWHSQGRSLHAGNSFGETILHAAARRGATAVVRLMLHECQVPVQVCCDYQRTVLHDACWTVTPHWDCIEVLLDACPDLLFVQDCRGHTPLQYVPKEHWGDWCRFLQQRHEQPCSDINKSKLEPRELHVIIPVQDE